MNAPLPTRRILGIDPGLQRTGFGVVEVHGTRIVYAGSGVIRVPVKDDLPTRLRRIFDGLREVLAEFRPTEACVEQVFVNVNPHSTLLLGQARGAAIVAMSTAGLAVAEYTPGQIKQAVTGSGRAKKEQVQHMMVRLLSLPGEPSKDAADALACAVCHAHGGALLGALGDAARSGAGALSAAERLLIESGRDANGGTRPRLAGARGVRVRRGRLVAS